MNPKLRVGAHVYELIVEDPDDGECGTTDCVTSTITINARMSQSMKEATLVHELFHACNTTFGDDPMSHALLDSLADQLYAALEQNGLLNKQRLSTLLCGQPPLPR